MTQTTTARALECPECGAHVSIATDAMQGEIISCDGCSAELELVSLDPLELALAPEVAEDWGE